MAAPTRSATGSTRSFQTGRVASTHSARLQATAEAAPDAARSRRRATGRPATVLHGGALAGAHTRVLRAVLGALGDRLAGDLLGHVPVHRAALIGKHLPELLEGGSQVGGVQGSEHRGERVVGAGTTGSGRPESERVGRTLTTTALLVLLLALVAVLRLLRRKAESEWGVTHGIPRLVRPPVPSGGWLPDNTTQRNTRARWPGLRRHLAWAGWMPTGLHACFAFVLKTTAGDAR